jgi:hypothetical protein
MQELVRSDEDEENRGGSKIVGFFLPSRTEHPVAMATHGRNSLAIQDRVGWVGLSLS